MEKTLKLLSEVTGNGKPLVLVPGGLTGWKSWEPYVSSPHIVSRERFLREWEVLQIDSHL